jgi:hypothetical protein
MVLFLKSSASLSGATIEENVGPGAGPGDGIRLGQASSLVLRDEGSNFVREHDGTGIECFDSESSLDGDLEGVTDNEVDLGVTCTDFGGLP